LEILQRNRNKYLSAECTRERKALAVTATSSESFYLYHSLYLYPGPNKKSPAE
jgi:hypothetical protein